MSPVLNIAAYRFVPLDDAEALRERLLTRAAALNLKGTVLLAAEGINLFLAGEPSAVRDWLDALRQDPRFADLVAKQSWSDRVPFRHLRIKCKREIIRMDHPTIRPADGRAAAVDSTTLARWLDHGHDDAGQPVVMLDTRNAFEVDRGRFTGAIDWRLGRFGEFPRALAAQREALRGQTVVSYCTGGIRCEKAALLMRSLGLEHVLQLDGGILQYLAEVPGARHWQGDCVVFDEREAVDRALAPAPAAVVAASEAAA